MFLLRKYPHQRLFALALSLVLAGAVGNVIDRILIGAVIDFLDFHALGYHWPAFNVADSAITCGRRCWSGTPFATRRKANRKGAKAQGNAKGKNS